MDLNYSIVDDWRQWHTNDQVAGYSKFLIVIVIIIYNNHYGNINGQVELIFVLIFFEYRYTRTYSNGMTFAIVKASIMFLNRSIFTLFYLTFYYRNRLYIMHLCYRNVIKSLGNKDITMH